MRVINRQGDSLDVSYDEIKKRISRLCDAEMLAAIDIDRVVIQTINGIYDGISTAELDDLSARICASLQSVHFVYDALAARILVSNIAKNVRKRLADAGGFADSFSGKTAYAAAHAESTLDPAYVAFVAANAAELDAAMRYERDATHHSYFSLRTLEKSYLMRIDGQCVETPQDMWMRVAVVVGGPDAANVYDDMSRGDYTHATPTLFNAGMRVQQCSSCFVAGTEVPTVNAGVKRIEDVAIGDVVRTHTGAVMPVSQLHRNARAGRALLAVAVRGEAPVVATVDHRFWAMSSTDVTAAASWVRADELIVGAHMVATAIAGGGVVFVHIDSVAPRVPAVESDDVVYTLGVEEDHSYAVGRGGLVAQNCYLLGTDDSLSGIFKTLADCAQISKWAGGIGLHVSNVRAKGSRIASTNGTSDGIVPMLKVYNECARYCNQSGRRKGSIAIYLEPWHADVWEFVELRRNVGAETERTRDLFLALWVPDEFMRRLEADEDWYLMSPDQCPGLIDAYDEVEGAPGSFSALYNAYVDAGKFIKKVRARSLWQHVLNCQLETGVPYVMFKDHVNRKCNQSNVGTIRSSNLCAEITEYSDATSYAVCNLASIAVNRFVKGGEPPLTPPSEATDEGGPRGGPPLLEVDHQRLHEAAKQVTRNLNRVIDVNSYPTPESATSNVALRPIGVGVQGLGDLYCLLGLPYDDPRAIAIDAAVMETIYHGCVEASCELAERDGPYSRFEGSPASEGRLQFDLWGVDLREYSFGLDGERVGSNGKPRSLAQAYDWDALKARVAKSGLRNSLLTALMPTATTSQILGNCESFEPIQGNVFKRSTMAGEFVVVNRHLMDDLMSRGLWSEDLRRRLLAKDGSVQAMPEVPDDIKRVYRTVWEVPQRAVIDHAAARGPFVDQSQSMNLYLAAPSFQKLSSALLHAWRSGLKTGVYYLRSTAAVEAIKYGILSPSVGSNAPNASAYAASNLGASMVAGSNASVVGTGSNAPISPAADAPACRYRRAGDGDACEMCSS